MQVLMPHHPLPAIWNQAEQERPARRCRIGNLQLHGAALEQFNEFLNRADPQRRQLNADQLACAARALYQETHGVPIPPSIYDRLRCAALLRMMRRDEDWEPDDTTVKRSDTVLLYVMQYDDLIPHDAPVIGHLDDAILVDVAWPTLSGEAAQYLDYRRLREMEAELRGIDPRHMHFRRSDWLEARDFEQKLLRHARALGLNAYAPAPEPTRFRVH